ncbi:hypothetical protein DPMN_113202 [Dreissena polymorpha]|uniref:Ig-like domain-containing protein n=1 Tax=Dreissena polymorpha TaxID=45954 RepID=A0A9D4KH28_DREPO|nr:hypothetical protein DPMN_113202 [Dreissena polymorpha]
MNEIECNASCTPDHCTYTWAKDGKFIGNTSMLVLPSVQKENAGSYQCTARNPASTASETSHTVFVEILI